MLVPIRTLSKPLLIIPCLAAGRLRLRPRILRDVSKVDTTTTLLGHKVSSPICIAPTAMQRLANDAGEKATARGKLFFPCNA